MAAFRCSVRKLLSATKHTAVVSSRRCLRVDPEEEIERLFLKSSFEQRKWRNATINNKVDDDGNNNIDYSSASTVFKNVGRSSLLLLDTIQGDHQTVRKQTPQPQTEEPCLPRDRRIPLHAMQQDDYIYARSSSSQAVGILHHYNVFLDLFKEKLMFSPDPAINFKVAYKHHTTLHDDDDYVYPVFLGNKMSPQFASSCPLFSFTGYPHLHYTLLFLNMDGHLLESHAEYLHWSCVNMRGEKGTASGISCEYLQPLPPRGTGFHRYIFILLEHELECDPALLPNIDSKELHSRTFNFSEFYSNMEGRVVPVGIHFFQSEWDSSVRNTFHNVLGMAEPAFQYDYPKKKRPMQVKYPHKEPFQKYLDMYRDKKEVAEEVLKEHLSEISPFKSLESQQPPYPLATPTKPGLYPEKLPATWLQDNMRHKANKTYKYTYIYKGDS